ncbi:heterocycloanthracin/sonorensin family bacteriocin [Niallia oryzisoli]|uniref:Heterocycloanthracin/sonorensin family bacteriocin n=1 Tax=Niallia oryzisoli TaxID=1737571 RepID=A0ABZ2CBX5_9BACI
MQNFQDELHDLGMDDFQVGKLIHLASKGSGGSGGSENDIHIHIDIDIDIGGKQCVSRCPSSCYTCFRCGGQPPESPEPTQPLVKDESD